MQSDSSGGDETPTATQTFEAVSDEANDRNWWSYFDKLTESCGSEDAFVDALSQVHTFLSLGAEDLAKGSLEALRKMLHNQDDHKNRRAISPLHIEAINEIAQKLESSLLKALLSDWMIHRSLHLYCTDFKWGKVEQNGPKDRAKGETEAESTSTEEGHQYHTDSESVDKEATEASASQTKANLCDHDHNGSSKSRTVIRKSCPATISARLAYSIRFPGRSPWKHGINTPSCLPGKRYFGAHGARLNGARRKTCQKCKDLQSRVDTMEMQIQTLMTERKEQESHFKGKILTLQKQMSGEFPEQTRVANGHRESSAAEYPSRSRGSNRDKVVAIESPLKSDDVQANELRMKVEQLRGEFSRLQKVADEEVQELRTAMKTKLKQSKRREEKLVSLVHHLSNKLGLDGIALMSRHMKR
eukprot:gb/GECG01013684.1/.p1 GENE.gb/GECG01013684.1/~~gb/GECG01013684.1/.p1  ORF type:complete len:415 (+),score=60.29 gb/GECG01013684.1/:1-1245(+)